MRKILHVAVREFVSTVATKGFIIGILITPLIIGVMILVMPRLMKEAPPKITGEVALIDPSGTVVTGLAEYLAPDSIAKRREDVRKAAEKATPPELRALAASPQAQVAFETSLQKALGEVPRLNVVSLPTDTPLEQAKAPLREKRSPKAADSGRLALVVIHPDAVVRAEGRKAFGSYDLYVRGKLDDRIQREIQRGLEASLIAARVRASNLDQQLVSSMTSVPRVESVTVTAEGEKATNMVANMLVPMGFMMLILVSVMTGGQYLLTTTVEEKSNRVVEVLLSAVSPMELMVGKILGQMAAGFVILALYAGLGVITLVSFALAGMLDAKLILFLVVFYVLAYVTIASFMAAIGSAVNEMREAQTLMTPVMLVLMIPWLLWMPITRDPNSTFAVLTSFIPPLSSFVMLLRMTSTAPPPLWQPLLAVLVSAAGAWGALWFASKVFRIGLLMFGKPPTFGTLVRWVRMG